MKLAATFNVEERSLVWNSFSVCSTVVLALSGFLVTAQAAYETMFTATNKQVRVGLDKVRLYFNAVGEIGIEQNSGTSSSQFSWS